MILNKLSIGDIFKIETSKIECFHSEYANLKTLKEKDSLPAGIYYLIHSNQEKGIAYISTIEMLRGDYYLLGKKDVYILNELDLNKLVGMAESQPSMEKITKFEVEQIAKSLGLKS